MDAMMARYLDGTLSDGEANDLLDALAADPHLEAEMKAYEELLVAASELTMPHAPRQFTNDVMKRLSAEVLPTVVPLHKPQAENGRSISALKLLATAATVILIVAASFGVGRIMPTAERGSSNLASIPASGLVMPVSLGGNSNVADGRLQLVRFAHVPSRTDVGSVTVAGSFNDWNPTVTPMSQEGNAWVTYLLLPADWHEYMFVENGDAWVTDSAAPRTVNDGFGNENAVLDLSI